MAIPFYVPPQQMMQDKAEYAKAGIAKGRSTIAMEYRDGIVLAADNPSLSIYKISEIYDRIAFAGAGKYSEFENLRKAGIRHADLKGYMYSREDVTAKSLANAYSQVLGTIFSQEVKPLEVEIIVVEVGADDQPNQLYRISFDGSIYDDVGFAVVGGRAEAIQMAVKQRYREGAPLETALAWCMESLEQGGNQKIPVDELEVALLSRQRTGRRFHRVSKSELERLLSGTPS
ncbi:MAG: proteasome subunit alpha [Nitrospirota bacterium]